MKSTAGEVPLLYDLNPDLEVDVVKGSDEPILGWVSRRYHSKEPGTTIVARCRWTGSVTLDTRMTVKAERL